VIGRQLSLSVSQEKQKPSLLRIRLRRLLFADRSYQFCKRSNDKPSIHDRRKIVRIELWADC
jgi:hypothetical protein